MRKQSIALVLLALVPLACSAETVESNSPPNFIIMIGVEGAEATLQDRAARIGRSELPIDLAAVPQL